MRVLSLDTTTRDGSVAIVEDDCVVDERRGDASRTHAERLPAEIVALLDARGLTLGDVDLFAVASGPGSFTGLRIGLAAMQGLALVRGRGLVGVPALEALAELGSVDQAPGARIAAWMDAHRGDVFVAIYEVTAAPIFGGDRLVAIDGPTVGAPEAMLRAHGRAGPDVVIGDGATKYRDAIERQAGGARILPAPALAGAIGRLAAVRAARGASSSPAAIQPLYVRRPDAELARDGAARIER
jgi:tRNA threonylcarbamoyladenosine biosynthesis protein TsaB